MISGRFSIIAFTIVMIACTAAGIRLGSSFTMVVSTSEKRPVTVCSSTVSSSPTASISAPATEGSAATMFWITGVMFLTTLLKASITSIQSFPMSASARPKPVIRFLIAPCMEPMDPEIVCSASFAVVPVMSMLVWITWMASTTSA